MRDFLKNTMDPSIVDDFDSCLVRQESNDQFRSKWYARHLHFNTLLAYSNATNDLPLYGGGLGLGNYIEIWWRGDYILEVFTSPTNRTLVAKTSDWHTMVQQIDAFFDAYKST